ncbi:MAG: DNA polymerase I, partial [Lachnospiraceae bacterium]|nr:DNA polymerase I [Lachnospiraceae bacterium]
EDVKAALGVTPLEFIQVKALQGDQSDNIPGVPKIGPKTATELIQSYGTVTGVYENLEDIKKASVRKTLSENRKLAELSLKLAAIKTDGEVVLDMESAAMSSPTDLLTAKAYEFCKRLGLRSTFSRFDSASKSEIEKRERKVRWANQLSEAEKIFEAAAIEERFAFSLYGELPKAIGAIAFNPTGVILFPLWAEGMGEFLALRIAELLKQKHTLVTFEVKRIYAFLNKYFQFLKTEDIKTDNIKNDLKDKETSAFEISYDILNTDLFLDLQIGAYLVNPVKSDYRPDDVAREYAGLSMVSYSELFKKLTPYEAYETKQEAFEGYLFDALTSSLDAVSPLLEKLSETGTDKLFKELEMPLSLALWEMEEVGILVKKEELKAYGDKLSVRIGELEKSLHAVLGEETNINSTKQLGEVLFGQMKLPGAKKTKTGYSTAADILEKLAPDYPVIQELLEYRGLAKLKSTYADGLFPFIQEDGRIHSHFLQTITATGRISSADPNLQNIPPRTEQGKLLRGIFVPQEGCSFTDADYSQIELRILAHMAEDPVLIEAFLSEKDIHGMTAAQVFHIPFEEVSPDLRRRAKAVNFGIIYGISSFGLAQDLNIPVQEAAAYMESYFATFPKIKAFQEECIKQAWDKGYSKTLFGRRRPIPELKAS